MKGLKRFMVLVATLFTLAVMRPAVAQEAPPSQFEHIAGLESFVGLWQGESPEWAGDPVRLSCRLTSNRSYLHMELTMQIEGQRQVIGTMLIGKDHDKNHVSMWGFWADQQTHGVVDVTENTASWEETGMRYDGVKSSARVAINVDGDQLTVKVTDILHGDTDQPDMNISFERRQRRGE